MNAPVLEVKDLAVGFLNSDGQTTPVVRDVSFSLYSGRTLGVAGESGCGKSTAVLSALGFATPGARRLAGSSRLDGGEIFGLERPALRKLWGRRIAYVAQDAAAALNPLHRVGRQIGEVLDLHSDLNETATRDRILTMLDAVGIPDPVEAAQRYPWQFSGGQQQRIALASAMVCEPDVLILDEPTTGLDVTTQAQITELIGRLVKETGTAALHISHDLAMLADTVDDLIVMYGGEVVERGRVTHIAQRPRHPYSAALLDAVPRVDDGQRVLGIPGLPPRQVVEGACSFAPRCRFVAPQCTVATPPLHEIEPGVDVRCVRAEELGPLTRRSGGPTADAAPVPAGGAPVLELVDVSCSYGNRKGGATLAVDHLSATLMRGETLSIVGESGSGKSTLLRAVAGLHPPDSGTIQYAGERLATKVVDRPRSSRRAVQLVFQNQDASLNPTHTVRAIMERPLVLFRPAMTRADRRARVHELCEEIRLDPHLLERRPHELSGGQKQRVALARAFAADPEVLLCDEVVSALDVSVQAIVLDVLLRLAHQTGTALLFVTHDLGVVRQLGGRVAVMRRGQVCETGAVEEIFNAPEHPYTRTLLAAVPKLDTREVA